MDGLTRVYTLDPEQRDNLLTFEPSEGLLSPASGWLRITQLDENISGTFNVVVDEEGDARTVTGDFSGPLGISCNVQVDPSDSSAQAEPTQPGASWVGVGAEHPFCMQYR